MSKAIKSKMMSSYSVTDAWANVTGLLNTIVEDGLHDILCNGSMVIADADGSQAQCYIRLAIDGNPIQGTQKILGHNGPTSGQSGIYQNFTITEWDVPLSIDDDITLQAKMESGDNDEVVYNADWSIPSLTTRRVG